MTKDSKGGPPDKQKRASALLDELDSVKSLLGDAARDVPQAEMEGEEGDPVPTLLPEDDDGQIPLLGGDSGPTGAASQTSSQSVKDSVRQALSERQNPFLSAARAAAASAAATTPASSTQRAAPPPTSKADSYLSDQDIQAMVNDLLAAWMPRIEQELRQRLINALRSRSKR